MAYLEESKRSLSPNITVFKEMITKKYKTKKYLALKHNTQGKSQARWILFIDSKQYHLSYLRSNNYIIINVCT